MDGVGENKNMENRKWAVISGIRGMAVISIARAVKIAICFIRTKSGKRQCDLQG